jgi:hypothetical protein
VAAASPGCPVSVLEFPAPPGRVVAVGEGPSAVTADGILWSWSSVDRRWSHVGNLLSEPTQ